MGIGCILAAFKTNQLALLSNECPSISPSEPRLSGEEGFLGGSKERGTVCDYTQEHLFVIRDKKVPTFVKFEIIPRLIS